MTHFTKLFVFSLCASVVSTSHGAWFTDRDNSMVDATDAVGDALFLVQTSYGTSIGTKIHCPNKPGTVITTAHGVMDKKGKVAKKLWGLYIFPQTADGYARFKKSGISSPQLGSWSSDPTEDYAFISPDTDNKPDVDGIRLLRASSAELTNAANSGSLDVYLYRAKPRYKKSGANSLEFPVAIGTESNGKYEYSSPTVLSKVAYDVPQKVTQPCRLAVKNSNHSITDCPMEPGTSGSPLVVKSSSGVSYVTGIVEAGPVINMNNFDPQKKIKGSKFINSDQFCTDYQKVCGVSCADIHTVLPKMNKK